jgi:hypothetical protein
MFCSTEVEATNATNTLNLMAPGLRPMAIFFKQRLEKPNPPPDIDSYNRLIFTGIQYEQ